MTPDKALQPYLYDDFGRRRFSDYFQTAGARETCRAVKFSKDPAVVAETIRKMSAAMAAIWPLDVDSILIPAPQHIGNAEYTKQLAEEIADLTGARVADILKCRPHQPLYEQKKEGKPLSLELYLAGPLPPTNGHVFFIDNCIGSGKTYTEAQKLIGRPLVPLVYAVDYGRILQKAKTACR